MENEIIDNYKLRLSRLDKVNLTKFIHILEKKLVNIDRHEIHRYTNGRDDGFLYARCFASIDLRFPIEVGDLFL